MEKSIKDYLHFYLGQKCKGNEGTMIYTLATVHKYGQGSVLIDEYGNVCVGIEFKPILRPLSSMTEVEAKDLAHTYTGLKITYVRIQDGQVIFNYLEGDQVHENVLDVEIVNPDSFRYLLSKGFDLFGLIHDELAIDKTKQS